MSEWTAIVRKEYKLTHTYYINCYQCRHVRDNTITPTVFNKKIQVLCIAVPTRSRGGIWAGGTGVAAATPPAGLVLRGKAQGGERSCSPTGDSVIRRVPTTRTAPHGPSRTGMHFSLGLVVCRWRRRRSAWQYTFNLILLAHGWQ